MVQSSEPSRKTCSGIFNRTWKLEQVLTRVSDWWALVERRELQENHLPHSCRNQNRTKCSCILAVFAHAVVTLQTALMREVGVKRGHQSGRFPRGFLCDSIISAGNKQFLFRSIGETVWNCWCWLSVLVDGVLVCTRCIILCQFVFFQVLARWIFWSKTSLDKSSNSLVCRP